MATEVKLPRLGQGMESGTIVRWLKSEGEAIAKGEPLFELDTDKVTQEVEADSEGVLLKIVVADGEVDVGTTVGIIGAQDEDVSGLLAAPSDNGDAPATEAPEPGPRRRWSPPSRPRKSRRRPPSRRPRSRLTPSHPPTRRQRHAWKPRRQLLAPTASA